MIGLQPEMELVGVAASASEAVGPFRKHGSEVVLMDLDLPDSGGIHAIREIREVDPAACILGLLMNVRDESATLALRAARKNVLVRID